MKRAFSLLLLIALALVGIALPSADVAAEDQTIVEIAVGDDRFETLVAAVVAADLVDTLSGGDFTVFAPTDAAFAKLGLDADNIGEAFPIEVLTDILLYHVLVGEVTSSKALTLQGDITMANGQLAGLKVFEGDLYINDDSKVIIADVDASNGVIHAVDTVILGPWPRVEEPADAAEVVEAPAEEAVEEEVAEEAEEVVEEEAAAATDGNTIVDIAIGDDRFETLVAAVVAADLVSTLQSGEYTVFAPTDDAFAKLGLDASNIADAFTQAELVDILLYHVLVGEVTSSKALALQGDITMANGELAGLKVFDGDLYINDDSKVILADVDASNGVIHAVDTVILGPWPR